MFNVGICRDVAKTAIDALLKKMRYGVSGGVTHHWKLPQENKKLLPLGRTR